MKKTLACYTQDCDFEISELGEKSLDEAIAALDEFSTSSHARQFQENPGPCRPCIGFQRQDGSFLEFAICADAAFFHPM